MRWNRGKARTGTESIERTELLTIRQACRLLNVHANTLRRWGEKGIVKAYRLAPSGQRRFRAEDIALLLVERPKQYRAKIN